MRINNTFFTVRLGAAAVVVLSLLVTPVTYLHAVSTNKKAIESKSSVPPSNNTTISNCDTTGRDTADNAINNIDKNINEIYKNIKAAIAEFSLNLNVVFPILFIITIIATVISIFLYLLQKKLQESIVRLDEADKKLMELIIRLNKVDKKLIEANSTIGQMRKNCSEKCLQQESSSGQTDQKIIDTFKKLCAKSYKKTELQFIDLQSSIVAIEPRINELRKFVNDEIEKLQAALPGNSPHESEQWKKWEEAALTEYRTLMRGNREREEIKQFRERYDILNIKRGSQGNVEKADDNSYLWAMKQSDNQYLVVPSDKFYNQVNSFYSDKNRLAHDTFNGVMEFVQQTETASEWLIKPGVLVTSTEGVFTVSQTGKLCI